MDDVGRLLTWTFGRFIGATDEPGEEAQAGAHKAEESNPAKLAPAKAQAGDIAIAAE